MTNSARPSEPETVESTTPVSAYPGIGSEIGGMTIEAVVDRGGMGIVYRAFDSALGRDVALKIMAPSLALDQRFHQRFVAESRTVASLDDPHILPVYQSGEEAGLLYLASKLVTGGDLRQTLKRVGRMSPEQVATVITQIGEALEAAHSKGLIHRDVKPANVLVEHHRGPAHYYLTDFGLTRTLDQASEITGTGQVFGTVDYMAPELIEGAPVDGRVDIYALGCMAIELLSGNSPFERKTKRETMLAHLTENPKLPGDPNSPGQMAVARVLGRAIAKNPESRYSTNDEFATDFWRSIGSGTSLPQQS